MGLPESRRAFATLMAEVSRRGEIILDEATPARRRALLAIAVREDEEFARDSFLRFAWASPAFFVDFSNARVSERQ